ncbi:hypothetical protein [Kordia sp.]|uniref:hypothetical protein n=1 Tax=Kordia sp. TaxID=1965332 RepID=UPI003D2BC0F2
MKKKKLKSLDIKKSTVSNLNKSTLTGGALVPNTHYVVCGTGPQTIICTFNCTFNCTFQLGCGTYNSQNRCKTIEVDPSTLPIC